jgi:hypothetical protein
MTAIGMMNAGRRSGSANPAWSEMMMMRRGRVLLGLGLVGALAFAATARQGHPPPRFPCKAFAKSEQGDWIPVRDVRLRGPGGSVEIKAGAAMLDELQEHLELRCH